MVSLVRREETATPTRRAQAMKADELDRFIAGPSWTATTENGHPQSATGMYAERGAAIRLHQVVSRLRDSVRFALNFSESTLQVRLAVPRRLTVLRLV